VDLNDNVNVSRSTMKRPKQVVTEWAVAFNSRDAAAAAALQFNDATNIQVALGEPLRGPQAMRDSLTAVLGACADSYSRTLHKMLMKFSRS